MKDITVLLYWTNRREITSYWFEVLREITSYWFDVLREITSYWFDVQKRANLKQLFCATCRFPHSYLTYVQFATGIIMVFCFVQKIFFGQHESSNIYYFCRAKRKIFFKNFTLSYMTKALNQIFFPHPKSEYFFQQHWESEYFFFRKHLDLFGNFSIFPVNFLSIKFGHSN